MKGVEKIAKKFSKFCLVDAGMAKYKPSIMAATYVFLGFQLQFEIVQEKGLVNLGQPSCCRFVNQLCILYRHWRFTVLDKWL